MNLLPTKNPHVFFTKFLQSGGCRSGHSFLILQLRPDIQFLMLWLFWHSSFLGQKPFKKILHFVDCILNLFWNKKNAIEFRFVFANKDLLLGLQKSIDYCISVIQVIWCFSNFVEWFLLVRVSGFRRRDLEKQICHFSNLFWVLNFVNLYA